MCHAMNESENTSDEVHMRSVIFCWENYAVVILNLIHADLGNCPPPLCERGLGGGACLGFCCFSSSRQPFNLDFLVSPVAQI